MTRSSATGSRSGWGNTLAILVCAIFLLTSAGFAGYVVGFVEARATYQPEPIEPPNMNWRPDVSTCPEDVALWDCIRHVMYRRDI